MRGGNPPAHSDSLTISGQHCIRKQSSQQRPAPFGPRVPSARARRGTRLPRGTNLSSVSEAGPKPPEMGGRNAPSFFAPLASCRRSSSTSDGRPEPEYSSGLLADQTPHRAHFLAPESEPFFSPPPARKSSRVASVISLFAAGTRLRPEEWLALERRDVDRARSVSSSSAAPARVASAASTGRRAAQ